MGAIILLVWFAGFIVSGRTYYRRRCGISAAPGRPGIFTACMPSYIWPVMWFVEWYRNPAPCTHPEHVIGRQQAAQQQAHIQALINQEKRQAR
jgi:hypothetical protein